MEKPRINPSLVYNVIADALPMEGRDFSIDTAYDANNKPMLTLRAITDVGRDFIPHLVDKLSPGLKGEGMSVTVGGGAQQEIVTIASIAKRVEDEALASLDAKLKAAVDDMEKKQKELDRADAARKENATPETRNALSEARRAMMSATSNEARARYVSRHIKEIRERIKGKAIAAAKEDEQHGKSWAADMNAPLNSLFERQDVETKLKQCEGMAGKIAELEASVAELEKSAVATAKQYSLEKDGGNKGA